MDRVRVDKWVWAARCFKTRSKATAACNAGHVRIDGERVRASRPVKPGDVVEVDTGARELVLEVVALADRRGSASVAQSLYNDLTPPPEPYQPPVMIRERGSGRPTKRERRKLQQLQGD